MFKVLKLWSSWCLRNYEFKNELKSYWVCSIYLLCWTFILFLKCFTELNHKKMLSNFLFYLFIYFCDAKMSLCLNSIGQHFYSFISQSFNFKVLKNNFRCRPNHYLFIYFLSLSAEKTRSALCIGHLLMISI